jgi:hypothetical protein
MMTTEIPLVILGREAFEAKKLLVQQILNAVECEYPVGQGVQSLDVDISALNEGDALYVKDLSLPKGFKAITSLEAMIVNISVPSFKEETESSDTVEAEDGEDTEKDSSVEL